MVAHLAGEVDLSNAGDLRQAMLDAVPNTAEGMVVDLSVVSYLDSSGIQMLGEDRESACDGASSGSPWSRRPARGCVGVLTIAGAENVVPFEDSLDGALERVRGSDG